MKTGKRVVCAWPHSNPSPIHSQQISSCTVLLLLACLTTRILEAMEAPKRLPSERHHASNATATATARNSSLFRLNTGSLAPVEHLPSVQRRYTHSPFPSCRLWKELLTEVKSSSVANQRHLHCLPR
jgi:hypothetical protein